MKNYGETLKAIEILKQENKSKVRSVKLHLLKEEIDNLETTLEYKKGRVYLGIGEVASYENNLLNDFFESDDIGEFEKGVKSLKKALREAMEA
jgi:hypothetical protein